MRILILPLLSLLLSAACDGAAPGGTGAVVTGAGEGELLKMRAGPGLGFKIVLGLPDGTPLARHGCVTEVGQLWCKVSLAAAPAVSGYVSADYLAAR